jgi:hypothetical protein
MEDYCIPIIIVTTILLFLVCRQVYLSSRTLAQFRTFEDYVEAYDAIYDPALKEKVKIQLKKFLTQEETVVRRTDSWACFGRYMERFRIYISIEERGTISPETVSGEALFLECGEFIRPLCENTFSFQDSPDLTKKKAEDALRMLQTKGAFHQNDPAYSLLQNAFAEQTLRFMKFHLTQKGRRLSMTSILEEEWQKFVEEVELYSFSLIELGFK